MLRHSSAVKARLVEKLPPAITVESALVKNVDGTLKRSQYVVVDAGPPEVLDDDRLASPQSPDSDAEYFYPMKAVAVNAEGCLGVAQQVIGAIVGFRPVIAGRNCQPMELDGSEPMEPEYSANPPLFYIDMEFKLKSSRA